MIALALCLAVAPQELVRATARDLPEGLRLTDATVGDVDGDGLEDLVLGCASEGAGAGAVLVLRGVREGGFAQALRLDLTPDVVAWALGDVHPDAGREVVLFGAASVFAWRPRASEAERFVRLSACSFLWQLPEENGAFLYAPGVRDVDGDGLEDLVCPEPGGYTVALQRRGAEGASFEARRLEVPREVEQGFGPGGEGTRTLEVRLDSGEGEEDVLPGALLSLSDSLPAPQWVDWDADGRLDLVAQGSRALHLWPRAAAGAPAASFALPVVADRERRLDASYRAFSQDLDRDGRADVAIFAGDNRSSDVRTQVLIFTSGGAGGGAPRDPFGEKGVPRDLIVLAGFVASAEFVDLDGDGYPELVAHTVRPDLIDAMRSAASETFESELFVYRNERGRFARKPGLSWRYTVPIKQFVPRIEFVADASGDGLAELFARIEPTRVRLHLLRATPQGWTVVERPLWEGGLAAEARLRALPAAEGRPRGLVAIEKRRVTHFGVGR